MDSHNLYKEECITIAIDLGGTRIKIGLFHNGMLLERNIINVDNNKRLDYYLPVITNSVKTLAARHQIKEIHKAGMAFPGLVNPLTNRVLATSKKYEDAVQLDFVSYFKHHLNAAFFLENDARAALLGEWQYGAGKGCNDIVMMTLGTGVGTAVIMEGQLLKGRHFQAGCLGGHFTINYKGKPCTCGNIGCVEAEAATWNLLSKATSHPLFEKSRLKDSEIIDFARLFATAADGDIAAEEIKQDCLAIWSAGMISCIHAYDPEKIILGGGVMKSRDKLIPYFQKMAEEHAWTPWGNVKVEAAVLDDEAALYGMQYIMQIKKTESKY